MTATPAIHESRAPFEAVDGDYRYGEYWDGNAMGFGSAEISSGPTAISRRPNGSAAAFPA